MSMRRRIGDILLERQLVPETELSAALTEQPQRGHRLCSLLYLREAAGEDQLLEALSAQQGVPGIALTNSVVDLNVLQHIHRGVAERHSVLPIAFADDRLLLAMADPCRRDVVEEVEFTSGSKITAFLGLKGIVDAGLRSAYNAFEQGRRDLLHGPRADASLMVGHVASVLNRGPGLPTPDDLAEQDLYASFEELMPAVDLSTIEGIKLQLPEIESRTPAKGRILIVDDEADIRQMLTTALTKDGYEVIAAERGIEGLHAIQSYRPDLVLLDAMLPEIHGFEICKKVKSHPGLKRTAVIIMTAVYRGWRFAVDVKATYGADDYIEKPFSVVDVLRRIELLLESAQKPDRSDTVNTEEIEQLRRAGLLASKQGDSAKARHLFERALVADPFDARLHFMLAMSLQSSGETFTAIHSFERAVELAPTLFPALKNLAVLYEAKGFRNKATEMWERALRECPTTEMREAIRAHLIELLS